MTDKEIEQIKSNLKKLDDDYDEQILGLRISVEEFIEKRFLPALKEISSSGQISNEQIAIISKIQIAVSSALQNLRALAALHGNDSNAAQTEKRNLKDLIKEKIRELSEMFKGSQESRDTNTSLKEIAAQSTGTITSNSEDLKPPALPAEVENNRVIQYRFLRELAKYNFRKLAPDYNVSHGDPYSMQAQNLDKLFKELMRLREHGIFPPYSNYWVDLGCGGGLLGQKFHDLMRTSQEVLKRYQEHRSSGRIIGVDYAPEMFSVFQNGNNYYSRAFECDIADVDIALRQKLSIPDKTREFIGLFVSNNVFHWLYDPEIIKTVLEKMNDLLVPNGLIVMDLAAIGTGDMFLETYRNVLKDFMSRDNYEKWKFLIDNPIGLQKLDYLVDHATKIGLRVLHAAIVYDPYQYRGPREYVDDAMNYGKYVYLAPIHYTYTNELNKEDDFLKKLKNNFDNEYRDRFPNKQKYVHQQYMMQLILQKI